MISLKPLKYEIVVVVVFVFFCKRFSLTNPPMAPKIALDKKNFPTALLP